MHSYWQDLAWDCYISFFAHLYQSYGPWFTPKSRFRSISWEQIGRFSPNFIYAFILTRFILGLLLVIFRTFVPELWPLIYAKISFPHIILRTNWLIFVLELWPLIYAKFGFCSISWEPIGRFSPNFIYAFILTRSNLGLLHNTFWVNVLELWPLIYAKISFPLYILNKLVDFHQILYIHSYWQDLAWDCYTSFFAHLY